MQTVVAFLRAVNVRPRWVIMQPLRELLTEHGFVDVESYLQTGNLRLRTNMRSPLRIATTLERIIEQQYGFDVPCILRTPVRLREVLAEAQAQRSPFPGSEPRRYVSFCAETPNEAAIRALNAWDIPGERVLVCGEEIHWWLDKPANEAKLTNARVEKLVGTATTRDIKVVRELAKRWGA